MSNSNFFVQTIPEMILKMTDSNLAIGSSHFVHVTHINDPHSFYVRLLCVRLAVGLLEKRGPPLPQAELVVGKIVIYDSRKVGHLVRGRIQMIDLCERGLGTVCTVMAIDYGCVDYHVFVEELFLPEDTTIECEPLALHCQLSLCEPLDDLEFDSDAIDAMKLFTRNYSSRMTILFKRASTLNITLRTVCHPDDIAVILALLKFTKIYRMYSGAAFALPKPTKYIHRDLKAGDKLHVRLQSGSSPLRFFVAEIEEYKHYNDVMKWYEFTKYCMEQPALDVIEAMDGRACAVKVSNPVRFERAIVLRVSIPRAKALVLLVDWGKQIEANFEDIKPVGKEFNKCPPMAILCVAELRNCLKYACPMYKLHPGLEFLMEVLVPGNGFTCPNQVKLCSPITSTTMSDFIDAPIEE